MSEKGQKTDRPQARAARSINVQRNLDLDVELEQGQAQLFFRRNFGTEHLRLPRGATEFVFINTARPATVV